MKSNVASDSGRAGAGVATLIAICRTQTYIYQHAYLVFDIPYAWGTLQIALLYLYDHFYDHWDDYYL